MKLKHQKLLKRIIPLIIAVIVVAGTVFGYLGTIFAYAADDEDEEYAKITNITFNDSEGSEIEYVLESGRYVAWLHIELTETGYNKYKEYYSDFDGTADKLPAIEDDEYMTISLQADNFFVPSISGKPDKYTFSIDSRYLGVKTIKYVYKLDNVRPRYANEEMDIKVKYKDAKQHTDYLFHDVTNIKYSHGNFKPSSDDDKNSNTSDNSSSSKVTYYDDDDDDRKSSSSEDERAIPTPKIIITSFDIPRIVEYDEEFEATIEFLNNSQYKDLVNVTMTVTPSEGAVIRNGVNQRHYVKIPRRQSTSETFRFKAVEKLAAEAITLTVKFDYEYKFNKEYKQGTSEEVLSLTAIPKPEESSSSEDESSGTEGSISAFEVLSIVPPDKIYPGDEAYFTVKVINKDHQFDASNVQVSVTGEGLVNGGNTIYHGALAHSTQAEIEVPLQFDKAGSYPLEFTVIYEDSVGKDEDKKPIVRINDIKKEYTATVLESPNAGMDMGMGFEGMMDPTLGMSGEFEDMPAQGGVAGIIEWAKAHIWWVAGGGVALIVVIVLVVRFIRKKKAEDDEDL